MLALFAGTGGLPPALLARLGTRPLVFSLDGHAPQGIAPDIVFRVERLGTLIADLKARGATEVCFAGAVTRPAVDPAMIDAATLPLVPVLQRALASGDDGALRGLIAVFEGAGLSVRAAHEIAPDLLPEAGVLTGTVAPGHEADAARGEAVVAAMAAADVGQACVVNAGQALAIEGMFGTDWMLASLAARPDGRGGLLYKAPKPGQDLRIDLPTIGPRTVEGAAGAGLDGIVIEAGGVIVLDPDKTVAAAERHGLFLWVRERVG
jgi:hypothetical protein